jgi:hypothetical protein
VHFENLEREIRDFMKSGTIKVPEFDTYASSFALLDAEIKEQKRRFNESLDDSPTSYLKFKRIRESLRELQPTTETINQLMKTISRIKLPIKFEVTPHNLTIHLLDSSFLPALKEALHQSPDGGDSTPRLDPETNTSLHIRRTQTGRPSATEGNTPEQSGINLNDKFNVHHSSRSRTKTKTSSLLEAVSPTNGSVTKLPRAGMFHPQRPAKTNFSNEATGDNNDVNLYNFKNIYESAKGKPPALRSHRVTVEPKDQGNLEQSPNRKTHASSSRTRDQIASSGLYTSAKSKLLDKTMVRRSSFNDLKFSTRYQKNVISIEDEVGIVSSQFIDENKLRNIISSFKTVPKTVKRIELLNNTFVCNPISVFKGAVLERSGVNIVLDLTSNKVLASIGNSRRDVEALKALNVDILN